MTIRGTMQIILQALQVWAQENNGSVHVANDVPHLFKLLGEAPGSPRAGILFAGETIRDPENADVTGRVDRKFWVAVSRGHSLQSYNGKSLMDGIAGGLPMFDLVESARDALREILLQGPGENAPYYMGIELLNFEGVTLDCYRIEIVLAADI